MREAPEVLIQFTMTAVVVEVHLPAMAVLAVVVLAGLALPVTMGQPLPLTPEGLGLLLLPEAVRAGLAEVAPVMVLLPFPVLVAAAVLRGSVVPLAVPDSTVR